MNEKQKEYVKNTDAEYVRQFERLRNTLIELTDMETMVWGYENEERIDGTIEQMRKTVSDLCRLRALVYNLEKHGN